MNLSRNGALSIAQIALSAFALALVYRHVIAVLGPKQLGLWSVSFAVSSLASLGDLGITAASVREIARARADRDWAQVRRVAGTCSVFALTGMILGGILLVGPLHQVSIAVLGSTSPPVPFELTLLATVLTLCMGLSTGAIGVLEAFERYDLKATITSIGYVLLIVLAYLLVEPLGVRGLGLALIGQALVSLVSAAVVAARLVPGRVNPRDIVSLTALRALLRAGLPLRMSAFLNIALEPLTRVLMVRFGGVDQAAIYEIVTRLILQARAMVAGGMQVILPRLVVVHRQSGRATDEALDTYLRMMSSSSLLVFATIALSLPVLSQFILGSVQPSFVLYGVLLCSAWFVNVLSVPSYFANVAHGTLLANWLSHATFAALNVALGIVFGMLSGARGVVLGITIAITLGSLVTVWDRVHRKVGALFYIDRVMLVLLVVGASVGTLLTLLDSGHVLPSGWLTWLIGASLFASIGATTIVMVFKESLMQMFKPAAPALASAEIARTAEGAP